MSNKIKVDVKENDEGTYILVKTPGQVAMTKVTMEELGFQEDTPPDVILTLLPEVRNLAIKLAEEKEKKDVNL